MSTAMMWQINSTASADTERLGEELGRLLKGGEALELCGDLGGGKTTFTRGLARGVGSQNTVASPTFTLKKIYTGRAGIEIHHFDFYRLSEPGIVADQLAESLKDSKVITVVEWSNSVKDLMPRDWFCIEFQPVASDSNARLIHIHYTEPHTDLIRKLETAWPVVEP